jgi:hypothetical protein
LSACQPAATTDARTAGDLPGSKLCLIS